MKCKLHNFECAEGLKSFRFTRSGNLFIHSITPTHIKTYDNFKTDLGVCKMINVNSFMKHNIWMYIARRITVECSITVHHLEIQSRFLEQTISTYSVTEATTLMILVIFNRNFTQDKVKYY